MTARRTVASAVIGLALMLATGVDAYLPFGIRWLDSSMPIRFYVTNRDVPGVTAPQLQTATERAFAAWGGVSNVRISAQFGGFVSNNPLVSDGTSVIGFMSRPDLDRVLGMAFFEYDLTTGVIHSSDVFLNSTFDWSVATNGESGRFDVQSVMTHELGHFLGLGHSAIGETEPASGGGRTVLGKRAVMFPIAYPRGNIEDRTLEADDVAGISDVYATPDASRNLGAISGRVTLNGAGVFGAHVTVFNPSTGALAAGYSLDNQGRFVIGGLPTGMYLVRAEPLDDVDLDSVFDEDTVVNINFRAMFYEKQVAVPPGGTGPGIEIKVRAK
jgi:hypothetical protein